MSDLSGKVVLTTGGGATVYIVGGSVDRLEIARKELLPLDENIHVIGADVADPTQCEQAIKMTREGVRRLDVMVNSAGVAYSGPFVSMTDEL